MYDIGFNKILTDPYIWFNPVVKLCGYNYYACVTYWMSYGIIIRNNLGNNTKVIEYTYVLQVIKGLCENYLFILEAYIVIYYI